MTRRFLSRRSTFTHRRHGEHILGHLGRDSDENVLTVLGSAKLHRPDLRGVLPQVLTRESYTVDDGESRPAHEEQQNANARDENFEVLDYHTGLPVTHNTKINAARGAAVVEQNSELPDAASEAVPATGKSEVVPNWRDEDFEILDL